ncbi:MAG: hypothetical protein Q4G59_07715, partial [Planctomycetia bacterium]|nr:hypothetical protein [Planctomycetia bacterium]
MTNDKNKQNKPILHEATSSESARAVAESILKDSIEYGVEYGLEDGIEKGISEGIIKGLREGASSTLVNGAEEAIGDYLGTDLDRPHPSAVDVVAGPDRVQKEVAHLDNGVGTGNQ